MDIVYDYVYMYMVYFSLFHPPRNWSDLSGSLARLTTTRCCCSHPVAHRSDLDTGWVTTLMARS